jgi:hypothetical protein
MTRVDAPVRSEGQRLEALDRANFVRTYRAGVKRELKRGDRSIRAVLIDEDDDLNLATMKVASALLATPGYGRVMVNKILSNARISQSKTLGGLSQRQRFELVEAIDMMSLG